MTSRPVSRVLYGPARGVAAIHLGCTLPCISSNLPGQLVWSHCGQARALSLFGLAPGGVYLAMSVTSHAVGSYPTLSPFPTAIARQMRGVVYFLWHFPWGRPRRTLSGTVAPGARTFLGARLSASGRRGCPADWPFRCMPSPPAAQAHTSLVIA